MFLVPSFHPLPSEHYSLWYVQPFDCYDTVFVLPAMCAKGARLASDRLLGIRTVRLCLGLPISVNLSHPIKGIVYELLIRLCHIYRQNHDVLSVLVLIQKEPGIKTENLHVN